jgi:hypothetical protein
MTVFCADTLDLAPQLLNGLRHSLTHSDHSRARQALVRSPGRLAHECRPIVHLVGNPTVSKRSLVRRFLKDAAAFYGLTAVDASAPGGDTLGILDLNAFAFDERQFVQDADGRGGEFSAQVAKARQQHPVNAILAEDIGLAPRCVQQHLSRFFDEGLVVVCVTTGTPPIEIGGLTPGLAERMRTVFVAPPPFRGTPAPTPMPADRLSLQVLELEPMTP